MVPCHEISLLSAECVHRQVACNWLHSVIRYIWINSPHRVRETNSCTISCMACNCPANRLQTMQPIIVSVILSFKSMPHIFSWNQLPSIIAVSYTHLDVYKRQVYLKYCSLFIISKSILSNWSIVKWITFCSFHRLNRAGTLLRVFTASCVLICLSLIHI